MSQDQKNVPPEMVETIKKFFEQDDKRVQLENVLNPIKIECKLLKNQLLESMRQNKETCFNTPNGSLHLKTSLQKVGIKQDVILDGLIACGELKDVKKAKEVVAKIWNNRPKEEKSVLTRV